MIRREQASTTAAQYGFPSRVGCSVISVHHSRSGAVTLNCRLTRSSSVASRGDAALSAPVYALHTSLAQEAFDPFVVTLFTAAQPQLGRHPGPSVGAARLGMNPGNDLG